MTSLKVVRDPKDPKEVDFIFTFEANEYLEDASLTITKSFSNIQSPDTQADVTSKKVPIQWKAGKDLTQTAKGAPASFFTWFAFEGNGNDEFDEGADIAMELADEIYPHAQKIFLETFVGDSDEEDEEEELDESGKSHNCPLMAQTARTRMRMRRKMDPRLPRNVTLTIK